MEKLSKIKKLGPHREYKKCMICGSEEYKVLHYYHSEYYPHNEYETSSWDGRQKVDLQIVKCKKCGLIYTNPAFRIDALHLVYPEDIVKQLDAQKLLRSAKWDLIIDKLKKYLTDGAVICDIGTRYGALVQKLSNIGFDAFGIEYNQGYVNHAKEIGFENIYQGTIDNLQDVMAKNSIGRVNAFIMDDVLEHLTDPVKDLKALAQCQGHGDFLFLRQMSVDLLGYKCFGKDWYYIQPAAHMYYFSRKSIINLLKLAGYELVKIINPDWFSNFKLCLKKKKSLIGSQIKSRLGLVKENSDFKKEDRKRIYLNKRYQLNDMSLVIARKYKNDSDC